MGVSRSILLAASTNKWLRNRAASYGFVRRTVSRFMPGEEFADAMQAAEALQSKNIGAVFTHLGENVNDASEAQQVTEQYLLALDELQQRGLQTEISIKLTQLGLDISPELCFANLKAILSKGPGTSTVWIDMESSRYVDPTLDIYRRALQQFPVTGICLQSYLFRSKDDVGKLLQLRPSIRLVKGAYNEPASAAFPKKSDVDENYFAIAAELLRAKKNNQMGRCTFGTHDLGMIRRITGLAAATAMAKTDVEVHMLYGIQRKEQERLATEGWRSIVLIAYGHYWYPWFVRRLAERPANAWFLLKNLV
ncbi:MAG TPA: proline dehydrogenase family protein [Candidatus Saccharimonadales bacterium]|nr:proline dehydrogenase family protein [Candidatus Saccharimonadales bacterium]